MDLHLLILTLFGLSGILLFVIFLLFFDDLFEGDHEDDQCPAKGNVSENELQAGKRNYDYKEKITTNFRVSGVLREIPFVEIKAATKSFCEFNLLHAGHSGKIYAGALEGRELVAVKRFEPEKSEVDYHQAELDIHVNVPGRHFLVPLLGLCTEGRERILVYKYMPLGDLARALETSRNSVSSEGEAASAMAMPWIVRLKIAIGIAEALVFLHHVCHPGIAHRDLKSSSILLTGSFDIKLGSLSEAQILQEGEVPVYDMYCFGKVLLDLISGLNVSGCCDSFTELWMLKALPLIRLETKDVFLNFVDPSMILDEDMANEVVAVALLAKACMCNDKVMLNFTMITVLDFLRNPQCSY